MTSTSLKGKITTTFPARVSAVAPLSLVNNNGSYTFTIDSGFLEDLVPPSTFLGLTDAPDSYAGQAGKVAAVNVGETALEFITPSGGPAPAIQGVVFLSDYLSGSGDQTPNIQAAFDVLAGTSGTLVWDHIGIIETFDTIHVGAYPFANNSGPTSFINILGVAHADECGISYKGPVDRAALAFHKNKFFYMRNLDVRNDSGLGFGTSTGISLGGQGGGAGSGTQTLAGLFENIRLIRWNTGIAAGADFGDASEHTFTQLVLYGNNYGFIANGFNCLDFTFNMTSMSDNVIGIHSGASDGFHVFGGSSTHDPGGQAQCDFFVDGNGHVTVTGWRLESARLKPMVSGGNGRSVSLRGCQVYSSVGGLAPVIAGTIGRISVQDCYFNGWIELSNIVTEFSVENSMLRVDPNTNLPCFWHSQSGFGVVSKINVTNCLDYLGITPVHDFQGILRFGNLVDVSPYAAQIYDPAILRMTEVGGITPNSAPEFGGDYLALSRVRQLAEGPVVGGVTPTFVTVATNAATAAGSAVLTFASVPTTVVPFMLVEDMTTGGVISGYVVSKTATTVTISAVAIGVGVLLGDNIKFWSLTGTPAPGKNLRVSGTFAGAGTLALLFERPVTVSGMGFASQQIIANAPSRFYPSDVGKPIRIINEGIGAWVDLYGHVVQYIDSTHIRWEPGRGQGPAVVTALSSAIIGEDEPDANYIVAGLVGDVNENFWVTAPTATGFNFHSSNAVSTANVVALIVR